DGSQVDDDGHVLVPAAGVAPHVLIDPDDLHVVESVLVIDEDPLALGEHGVVGGVPRDAESLGNPCDAQVADDETLQCPGQATAGELRAWLRCERGVLTPHVKAAAAPVAADRDLQRRRSPPKWFVSQPPDDCVARVPHAAAASAPLV